MKKWINFAAIALATVVISTSVVAQDQKDKPAKKDGKTEEIIIRKKGDKTGKITIVVDGDNVTVNGKPPDDISNGDVTVIKRNRIVTPSTPTVRFRNFSRGGTAFDEDRFERLMPALANKAMLGVMTEKGDGGAKITAVTKESGADKAGLKKDDVITKIGSSKIEDPEDLIKVIREMKPNEKVDITYKRDGKENKTSAILGENKTAAYSLNFNGDDFNFDVPQPPIPPMEGFNFSFSRRPKIGLQIQDVEEGKGVTVKDVDTDSPAAKAGIKEGDVITQVNGKEVAGVDELRTEIKDVKEGDSLKFSYKRDGKNQTAEIKIPKRLKTADL